MKKILSIIVITSTLLLLNSCNNNEDIAGRKPPNDNQQSSTPKTVDYSIAGVTGVYNIGTLNQAVIFGMPNDQKNIYGINFVSEIGGEITFIFYGSVSKTGIFSGKMMDISGSWYNITGKFQGNVSVDIGSMNFTFDVSQVRNIPVVILEGEKQVNPITTAMLLEFQNAYNDFQRAHEGK